MAPPGYQPRKHRVRPYSMSSVKTRNDGIKADLRLLFRTLERSYCGPGVQDAITRLRVFIGEPALK